MDINITYKQAAKIMDAIVAELEKRNKTAVIAVADSHGELITFLRMENTKLPSIAIAQNKAWTAARSQKFTSEIGKSLKDPANGFDISFYGDPKFTGFGGGVPVRDNDRVRGAVAVSGLSQEEDEELALIGVNSINL